MNIICSHNVNWLLYYRMSYKSTINSCQLCWKKKSANLLQNCFWI